MRVWGRRTTRGVAFVAAAVALLPGLSALASGPSSDGRDASAYVADGTVRAIAHQPGGNTYIGGDFSHVGPRSGHGVSLMTADPITGSGGDPVWSLGDPAFPEVAGGEVRAVVADGHGGWFIGGDFTSVAGQDVPRLAHIRDTGALDTSWTPKPNNSVLALALDSTEYPASPGDWTLYAGGKFTQLQSPDINSTNRNFLAAWRIDAGTGAPKSQGEDPQEPGEDLDSDEPLKWAPGQQAGNWVHALAVATVEYDVTPPGGATTRTRTPVVFAGGDFTSIGKTAITVGRFAGVWGDGALGPDAAPRQGEAIAFPAFNANATVRAIVAGQPSSPDPPATIQSVPVYIGGDFTGTPNRLRVAQLNVNLSGASVGQASFGSYTGWTPTTDAPVRALALDGASDVLYVGGDSFGDAAGQGDYLQAVRAIPDDFVRTGCTAVTCPATPQAWTPAPSGVVRALALSDDDSTVYAGGDFKAIGDQSLADGRGDRNGLAALAANGQPDGGAARPWDARPAGGSINALAVDTDSVYAGGGFFSVGASERHSLAALDPDGVLVDEFDTGTSCAGSGCADEVRALALDASRLYVGGDFTTVDDDPTDLLDGEERPHLAALDLVGDPIGQVENWNPSPDNAPTPAGPARPSVLTLNVAGARLYVGGVFEQIGTPADPGGPTPRNGIAALERSSGEVLPWDPDPHLVTQNPPPEVNVWDIEASCESVYVGGNFTQIGVDPPGDEPQPNRNKIAELNANTAEATAWKPDANSFVKTLEVSEDGSLVYAGGNFSTIGDATAPNGRGNRNKVAALRAADGSVTGWNPGGNHMVSVDALELSGDEETIYAGGNFTDIGGEARSNLAALQTDGVGAATGWDPSPYDAGGVAPFGAVRALAVTGTANPAGDNVYVGGEFTDVGSSAQRGYAQFRNFDPVSGNPAGELASSEPPCAPPPGPPVPLDTTAPSLGQAFVADGGQTLVVGLSEAAQLRVAVTGTTTGLMPLGRGATCTSDTAQIRAKLRRAFGKKLRKQRKLKKLKKRKRAKKMLRLIAKRACPLPVPPRSLQASGAAGQNRISLAGAGPLPPGAYQAAVTAQDGAGNQAQPVTINFQVSK